MTLCLGYSIFTMDEEQQQVMSDGLESNSGWVRPMVYQIRLEGYLGSQWTEWFDGLTLALEESGDTLLTGVIIDQAALHGLLRKVRDLGIPLISVIRVEPDPPDAAKEQE